MHADISASGVHDVGEKQQSVKEDFPQLHIRSLVVVELPQQLLCRSASIFTGSGNDSFDSR